MKSAQYIINREAPLGFICSICDNMVYSNCFHAWLNTCTDKKRVYEGGWLQSQGEVGKKNFRWIREEKMKQKRVKKVVAREGWIKESSAFSTWGAIDAVLDAATYEQVRCVWGLWPRLHFLHGYTSDWGALEPGTERQASNPFRPKMKGQAHGVSLPQTSKVSGREN